MKNKNEICFEPIKGWDQPTIITEPNSKKRTLKEFFMGLIPTSVVTPFEDDVDCIEDAIEVRLKKLSRILN